MIFSDKISIKFSDEISMNIGDEISMKFLLNLYRTFDEITMKWLTKFIEIFLKIFSSLSFVNFIFVFRNFKNDIIETHYVNTNFYKFFFEHFPKSDFYIIFFLIDLKNHKF